MGILKKYAVLIGISISLLFMLVAIAVYPGGTFQDKNSIGFDWANNFFSNLFGAKALNGTVNTSRYWAYIGMFFYSISCAIFFVNMSQKIPNKVASNFIKYVGLLTMPCTFLVVTPFHDLMLAISANLFWACIICITVYVLKSNLLFFKYYAVLCILIFYFATYLYISAEWGLLSLIQKVNNISAILLILGLEYFTHKVDFAHIK